MISMKYTVFATNEKTEEVYELGSFSTADEAWWNVHNNLEWDEEDNPDDYTFQVVESCDDDPGDDWGYNEDCGFDPYMGCYTEDC